MNLLQRFFIFTVNPLFKIVSKLNIQARNVILSIGIFSIIANCFMFNSWFLLGVNFDYKELFVANGFALCVVILFSITAPLKPIEWNKKIYIPWVLSGIFIILSSFHHDLGGPFFCFSLFIIIAFPCLFFVWNNRGDYQTLFKTVSISTIISTIIFVLVNIITTPMAPGIAYMGITSNPNTIGIASLAGVIASLYMILITNTHIFKILYMLSAATAFSFAYFSASRASLLAIIAVFIVFCISCIRSASITSNTMTKCICVIIAIVILAYLSIPIYRAALSPSNTVNPPTTTISGSQSDTNTQENLSTDVPDAIKSKVSRDGDLNKNSSGRIVIWNSYFNELNFWGHDRNEGDLYIEESGITNAAHNTYLEIAYRSGLLAGLCYAIAALYSAFYAIRLLVSKKYFDYRMSFIPMAVFAFGIMSHLERAFFPVEKAHIFMFFIALAPMFVKHIKND